MLLCGNIRYAYDKHATLLARLRLTEQEYRDHYNGFKPLVYGDIVLSELTALCQQLLESDMRAIALCKEDIAAAQRAIDACKAARGMHLRECWGSLCVQELQSMTKERRMSVCERKRPLE
jgi:hypothetical protein